MSRSLCSTLLTFQSSSNCQSVRGLSALSLSLSTTSSQSTTDATVYLCTFFFFIVFVFFQSRLVYLQQCVQQRHQQHSDNELSAICARALIRFCSSVFAAVSYSTHFKADFCYSAERELLKTSSRSSSTQWDQLTVWQSSMEWPPLTVPSKLFHRVQASVSVFVCLRGKTSSSGHSSKCWPLSPHWALGHCGHRCTNFLSPSIFTTVSTLQTSSCIFSFVYLNYTATVLSFFCFILFFSASTLLTSTSAPRAF